MSIGDDNDDLELSAVQIYDRETGEVITEPPKDALPPSKDLLSTMAAECVTDGVRWFPSTQVSDPNVSWHKVRFLLHQVVAMIGEVGEFANILKKVDRGTLSLYDPAIKGQLQEELVDVFIYLLNIAGALDLDLLEGYTIKREFNEKRFGK